MKYILTFLLVALTVSAQVESSPVAAEHKGAITELALTMPIKSSPIKSYIDARGVTTLPFTSGISNGAQIGRHGVISNQATVGLVASINMFIGTDSVAVSQIYQLGTYVTGRLYFGDSWRGGLYAELGAGPELSAAKFSGAPMVFQVNIASRMGVGYNYKFTDNVTIGLSLLAAPSLSASSIVDGTRVAISMLW